MTNGGTSTTLQAEISNQYDGVGLGTNTQKLPRTSQYYNSRNGNFTIPKGGRIALSNCNATCTGCDGADADTPCQLTMQDCDNSGATGLQYCVARFDTCSNMQQVECQNSWLTMGGCEFQELDITDTTATLVTGQANGDSSFTTSDIRSTQGQYQTVTISGGRFLSDEEQFETLDVSQGANLTLNEAQVSSDGTFDGSTVILNTCQFQDVNITSCHIVDNAGTYQDVTADGGGDATTGGLVFNQTQMQSLDITDLPAVLSGVQLDQDMTIENATVTGNNVQAQQLSVTTGAVIFNNSTFQGDATIDSSPVTFQKCTFQDMTVTGGAISSKQSTYQDFTCSNGTVTSSFDSFQDITLDTVNGPNKMAYGSGQTMTASGNGVNALELDHFGVSTLTLSDFGSVKLRDCSSDTTMFTNIGSVDGYSSQLGEATVTSVGILNAPTCDFDSLTLDNVNQAITANTTITAVNSVIIDTSSTITATSCTVVASDSDTTATACSVIANGGSVTATGASVVIANSAEVTNDDGLTIGTGFAPDSNAGCLQYGETGLTLQASIGNLLLNCLTGDIVETATVGDITDIAAAGIINEVAGLAITRNAGTSITDEATLEINRTAGSSITDEATTTIMVTAGGDLTNTAGGAANYISTGDMLIEGEETTISASSTIVIDAATSIDLEAPLVVLP